MATTNNSLSNYIETISKIGALMLAAAPIIVTIAGVIMH